MGWEDRPYFRDRGASSNRLSALLTGSVPLFTAFGIRVRAHSALIVFILFQLLLVWTKDYGPASKITSMAMLCGVLLLHEYGHCLAARAVGGWADEILLWPLGGLAFPDAPRRPGAWFCTVAGGPLANGLICLGAGGAVLALSRHTALPMNPLGNLLPPPQIQWREPAFYFWWIFVTSYLLLLLNLLPIYPLDGGKIVQSIAWVFVGFHRSMVFSCIAGMFGSAALAGVGLYLWNDSTMILVILAACLFFACYQERIILRENGPTEPWQSDDVEFAGAIYRDEKPAKRRANRRVARMARKRARLVAAERQRLDSILAKVSATGLRSLSWRERRVLRHETERRRKQEVELKQLLADSPGAAGSGGSDSRAK
ncbi:MAG: site-2 protease family protein [Tepidisphaeraceae bacterium]|jgi:Zn-dependent protease